MNAQCLDEDALCIELIRRELSTDHVGFEIHLFRELTSATDALAVLAASGAREGTVVLTETQQIRRGGTGTRWIPPERANLYASVLFRPRIARTAVPVFGLIGALALGDAIAAETGCEPAVRWPDELLLDGRRVARTRTCIAQPGVVPAHVILGVEVNANMSGEALARATGTLPRWVTSLCDVVGHPIDRNRLAAAFLNELEGWVDVYRTRGADAVLRAWDRRTEPGITLGDIVAVN